MLSQFNQCFLASSEVFYLDMDINGSLSDLRLQTNDLYERKFAEHFLNKVEQRKIPQTTFIKIK